MKRRIEITIETTRILAANRNCLSWCPACGADVWMVSTDEAAILARVSSRTIFQWIEAGKLHAGETKAGLMLVCFNSL